MIIEDEEIGSNCKLASCEDSDNCDIFGDDDDEEEGEGDKDDREDTTEEQEIGEEEEVVKVEINILSLKNLSFSIILLFITFFIIVFGLEFFVLEIENSEERKEAAII